MKRTLWQSPKYKRFVSARNSALEQINLNAQADVSRMLFEPLDQITGFVSHMALTQDLSLNQLHYLSRQLDGYMESKFWPIVSQVERRILRMRRATFTLTYLAELEAIARGTQRTAAMNSSDFKAKLQKQTELDTITGHKWSQRIWIALTKIKHDINEAFIRALSREESPLEVVNSVKKSYPKRIEYLRPPRTLKPLREADKPEEEKEEFDFYFGLTNDEDWELAVKAYKDTELPPTRFDGPSYDPEKGYFRYAWEVEQEMTDDFVSQVRDGQVQAANDLGVKDFVWVAIIDKKTCDVCCIPRNGKTTTEIEAMLSNGKLDADECDATVPPAHPYCRCDLAPVASTDEVEGPNWKSFDEWLNS